MKKLSIKLVVSLFIVALFGFQSSTLIAQDDQTKNEFEIIQDAFGLQKKDIILNFVDLDKVDVDAFWDVYNAYEVERKELGKRRLELLYNYEMKAGIVNDDEANELMENAFSLRKSYFDLSKNYYNKMKKATNPIVAAQFYQIEHYLLKYRF